MSQGNNVAGYHRYDRILLESNRRSLQNRPVGNGESACGMPPITILFVRTAFFYLVAGLATGILMESLSNCGNPVLAGVLLSEYVHMLTVGWLTQLIFGVAYWMFPQNKDSAPWHERVPHFVFYSLNLGLVIRIIVEPLIRLQDAAELGLLLVLAAVLQFMAALGFTIICWSRVRGKRNA